VCEVGEVSGPPFLIPTRAYLVVWVFFGLTQSVDQDRKPLTSLTPLTKG